jgi:hypothetical protein
MTIKNPFDCPIVMVTWKDHVSDDSWRREKRDILEQTNAAIVHSVGWLAHEDEETILLVQNMSPDGDKSMMMRILKSTITKRRILVR